MQNRVSALTRFAQLTEVDSCPSACSALVSEIGGVHMRRHPIHISVLLEVSVLWTVCAPRRRRNNVIRKPIASEHDR